MRCIMGTGKIGASMQARPQQQEWRHIAVAQLYGRLAMLALLIRKTFHEKCNGIVHAKIGLETGNFGAIKTCAVMCI